MADLKAKDSSTGFYYVGLGPSFNSVKSFSAQEMKCQSVRGRSSFAKALSGSIAKGSSSLPRIAKVRNNAVKAINVPALKTLGGSC